MLEINLVEKLGVQGGGLSDVLEKHYAKLRSIDSCENPKLKRVRLAMFSMYPCRVAQLYRFMPILLRERKKIGGTGLRIDEILREADEVALGLSEVARNKFSKLILHVGELNSELVFRYMYRHMKAFYRNK